MAVTLYTGSPRAVVVRVSALAELAAALHALAESDHHPASRGWIVHARAEGSTETMAQVLRFAPLLAPVRARYFLPLTAADMETLDDELADITRLPLEDFVWHTAQALLSLTSRGLPTALLSDEHVQHDFLADLERMSWRRAELGAQLLADPEQFRADLVQMLASAHASLFSDEWDGLHDLLNTDVQRRRRDLHQRGVAVLADFPTATDLVDPPRVVFDKLYNASVRLSDTPCVLVPSRHGNPHLVIKHLAGWPVVIQYAVGPDPDVPTMSTVRGRLAVLDQPVRLAICRFILRLPMSTRDLAVRLDMTSPQVSRHLRRLREAGLVHRHREGAVVLYELDREAVRRLGLDLLLTLYR